MGKILSYSVILGFTLSVASCNQCNEISKLPVTSPTSVIRVAGMRFEAANVPPAAEISVQDRYPAPSGDGKNEIWIPWSENGKPPASHARVYADSAKFPNGLSELVLTCAHFKNCTLQAFDTEGEPIGNPQVHEQGENTTQTFTFSGRRIGGVEIRGSEISILSVCPEP